MSREIDERVVAMQFDNVKFEKNAKATIKTLDQLKKSLNLDKAVQGFDGLKKAAENLKLDEVGRKVTELSGKFKNMHGIMEKAFKVTMSPLHGLESAFKTLEGYVTKFIGFDMAGKIVHTFENALRSLTISPIQAGWNEYELKMDSIKTIMSGTGESLDVVKDKLQELNLYADKTIYSFSDMTSSIGKFTNNGVKLDVATAAIKGVANATADAGQDARSASMAMYNLSQALGLGKMTTLDWKSFENANIATIRLKDSFIQAGVASGQLVRKVTKDSKTGAETIKYYTKDSLKKGKNKWVEVTAENFRETLSEGWLDKQTMLSTFQIFSGDLKTIEDLRRLGFTEAAGFTDEDCERMLKIGQDAMTAATQVRTFTKMFDALKEAAQSGWAQSIEFIFGDMEEGTSLWTTLNDKIGGLLERSAKARNDALAEWRGLRKNENGEYVATHDVWGYDYEVDQYGDVRRVEGSWHKISSKLEDGREVLVNSFMELLDVIRDVGGAVGDAWSSVFGKLDSEKLWSITRGFQDLVKRVKEWLGSTTDANSRLSKITKGLKGVFGILKVVINFVKNGVQLTGKILKPFTDMAIDVFAKFGEFFEGIGNLNPGEALNKIGEGFTKLWNKITGLSWDSVKTKFSNAWGGIKETVRNWANENGLGGVWETMSGWKAQIVELFGNVKSWIQTAWQDVTDWIETSGIASFFRDAWGWILKQFGIDDPAKKNPVEEMEESLLNTQKARGSSGMGRLLSEVNQAEEYGQGLTEMTNSVDQAPIVTWIYKIKSAIEHAWEAITTWPGWNEIATFFGDAWTWIGEQAGGAIDTVKSWFLPGSDENGNATDSPFIKLLNSVKSNIDTAWEAITGWPEWSKIASFFGDAWAWIGEKAGGAIDTVKSWFLPGSDENGNATDSPFIQLLNSIKSNIDTAWEAITGWPEWSKIASFFGDAWTWIGEKAGGAIDIVKSWFLPGSDENGNATDSPFIQLLNSIKSRITTAWQRVSGWSGWEKIGKFFGDAWAWIGEKAGVVIDAVSSLFIPGTDENGNQTDPPIVALLRNIKDKVQEVWNDIVSWSGWAGIGLFLNNAKDWVLKLIGGDTMASAGSEKGVSEQVAQLVEGTVATAEVLDEAADTTVEAEKSAGKMSILDTIFGKLGEYFDKVVGFVNQVASDTGLSSGLENVSKIFGIIHTVFSDIVDLLDVLFVKKDMGAFFTWLTENWTLVLAGISSIVLSFVGGNLKAKIANGAYESEGVGSAVLKIALGVLAIAGAVMLLSDIDEDKLIRAVGAITVIGSVIAGVIVAANLTKQKTQAAQEPQAWERIAGKLIGYAGIILILEEVLTKLPEFLEKAKGLGYNGDELIKTVTAVIELVGGLALITTIVGKFSGGNFKAILYGSLGTMMAFGMFLATVLTMVDTLYTVIGISQQISGGEADKKVSDYIEKIRNFGKILATIGEVFGGFVESFAYGFRKKNAEHNDELLKSDLEFMDEMAGEFTPQRISTLVRMATGLKDFIQAIPDSNATTAATTFIGLVPQLGAALGQFGLSFKQAFDADASNETVLVGISTTQTIIEMFRQLVRSMLEMGELWDDSYDYLEGMDDVKKFEDLGYTYTQAAAALARGVQRGISENGLEGTKITFDATPIVDAIVVALGLGEDAIATAVHNMVQAGINANAEKQEYDASQVLAGVQGYLSFMTGDTTDKMSELISGGLGMAMGQASEGFGEQLFGSMDPEKLLGEAESKFGDVTKKIGEQMDFGNLEVQVPQFVPGEDGNTQLEGWIADLQSQLESGDYANGLEVSIHPVIELSELDGTMAQIREYFDQNPIMVNADTEVPNIIFNLENNTTIDSIREVNASVVQLINRVTEENAANMQTIDNMATRINNIATAIRSMGIYLDTGVLAGAVDQKLGYSAFLFGRTGISKY